MTDALLIYPPYTYARKNPPLGLAYLASFLERAEYSVEILDMSAIEMDYDGLEKKICDVKPKIVGISFMTNQFYEAVKISRVIKHVNPVVPVIVGGPHASALPLEMLSIDSIDFVIIGEGENTMLELISSLLNNAKELGDIAGIAYKKGETGETVITPPREYIQDLDSIPFPAWHLLPIEKYSVVASGGDVKKKVLPLLSSRGCPSHCIFCSSHVVFGRKFRGRSAANIVAEIECLKNTYNVSQFDFVDDTITIDRNRLMTLCNLLIEKDLKIIWMCNARVNTVDIEMLELAKKAGCVRVDLGVESCDKKVLKAIKKGVTLEQIKSAHKLVQQVGLQSNSFLMVGNLEEDFDSVKRTVQVAKEFVEDANVAISTPFPGTELYQIAKKNGWLKVKDWAKYVTSPTYFPGYRPVMITNKMDEEEIIRSFFYVHSRLAKKKFETRYGKWFYFNPYFYSDKLFKISSLEDFIHKLKLLWKLVFQLFKER